MEATREDELNLGGPFLNSICLRLSTFVVLLEIVREVAIQIKSSCIVAALASITLPFPSYFETIRVHRWQDMDSCVVQQPLDVRVRVVTIH